MGLFSKKSELQKYLEKEGLAPQNVLNDWYVCILDFPNKTVEEVNNEYKHVVEELRKREDVLHAGLRFITGGAYAILVEKTDSLKTAMSLLYDTEAKNFRVVEKPDLNAINEENLTKLEEFIKYKGNSLREAINICQRIRSEEIAIREDKVTSKRGEMPVSELDSLITGKITKKNRKRLEHILK